MRKFRKKPVVIEAWQLSRDNHMHVAQLIAGVGYNVRQYSTPPMRAITGLTIETLEGDMNAAYGDWIIRGVKGEFYPCKPDIFEATYEPAMTDPAPSVQPVRAWAVVDKDGLDALDLFTYPTRLKADLDARALDRKFPYLAPHRVIRVEIREVSDE